MDTKVGDSQPVDYDGIWEEEYAKIEDQIPMFDRLPKTEEQARKVRAICGGHIGPIVLAKSVSAREFHHWLNQSELGLHKAVRLDSDTVYVPQACCEDHGTLRGLIPLLHFNITNPVDGTLISSSGELDGMNPDVKWDVPESELVPVVFEIGMSQSLPNLRIKALEYCLSAEYRTRGLRYVVLIKRYQIRTKHLYIEVWRCDLDSDQLAPVPALANNQGCPTTLNMPGCMTFHANAHAADPTAQGKLPPVLEWQSKIAATQVTLAAGDLHPGVPACTFDAQDLLNRCRYRNEIERYFDE